MYTFTVQKYNAFITERHTNICIWASIFIAQNNKGYKTYTNIPTYLLTYLPASFIFPVRYYLGILREQENVLQEYTRVSP